MFCACEAEYWPDVGPSSVRHATEICISFVGVSLAVSIALLFGVLAASGTNVPASGTFVPSSVCIPR